MFFFLFLFYFSFEWSKVKRMEKCIEHRPIAHCNIIQTNYYRLFGSFIVRSSIPFIQESLRACDFFLFFFHHSNWNDCYFDLIFISLFYTRIIHISHVLILDQLTTYFSSSADSLFSPLCQCFLFYYFLLLFCEVNSFQFIPIVTSFMQTIHTIRY